MRGSSGIRLISILAAVGAAALFIPSVARGAKSVNLSPRGILMLEKEEGFRSKPYKDIAGHWTIGYGTRISDPAKYPNGITKAEGRRLMLAHVNSDTKRLHLSSYNFPQNIVDALLILTYNVGASSILQSKMFRFLRQGNIDAAILEWNWVNYRDPVTGELKVSPGLMNRRAREVRLIQHGVYNV